LIDENWTLKARLCQQAGYDLGPYAGQDVSLTRYNLHQRYHSDYIMAGTGIGGESQQVYVNIDLSLYLWVIAKDHVTLGSYISVADSSAAYLQLLQRGFFTSDLLAINDENIK
jgi:hypothetical protein